MRAIVAGLLTMACSAGGDGGRKSPELMTGPHVKPRQGKSEAPGRGTTGAHREVGRRPRPGDRSLSIHPHAWLAGIECNPINLKRREFITC
jgi:hypothetical protein